MRLDVLSAMNAERAARRACVLVTDIPGGEQRLVKAADLASDPLADVLDAALRSGKSATIEHEGRSYFLTVQAPPARLLVIGAVHITQALAPMARIAGFDMTIVDPRTAFATPERFPDVRAHRGLAADRAADAGARPLHGGRLLHARSQDRRSGARGRIVGGVLLRRRARLAQDARASASSA